MTDRVDRPLRPFRIGVALVAVLLLFGAASPVWADTTQAQCNDEWAESSAADECTNEQITPSGDDCVVAASCQYKSKDGGHGLLQTTITVGLDSVSDLNNCDGSLAVGSC